MADVFLSYSRRDGDFVRKLHAQLSKDGRDVWVDWEDIPLSADWWSEIREAIEATDTFVFVISAESLGSPICQFEIAHAIDYNKRLIPVLRHLISEQEMLDILAKRELDQNMQTTLAGRDLQRLARENWQAISRHNWISFDDEDNFDANYRRLLLAIDTDLEYVRLHTRLLVRARDWDARQRSTGFLLGGGALREYADWLRQAETTDPKPTELQLAYLLTSQQAQSRRQTLTLVGIMTAVVLSAMVIVFLFAQNQQVLESEATRQAAEQLSIAQLGTNEAQQSILTEQVATNEAQRLIVTAQAATNVARQTSIFEQQQQNLRDAQSSFATLTQQAGINAAATAVFSTLESLVVENTRVVATNSFLESLATQLAFSVGDRQDELGTQIAQDIYARVTEQALVLQQEQRATEAYLGLQSTAVAQVAMMVTADSSDTGLSPEQDLSLALTRVVEEATATARALPTLTPSATPSPTATITPSPMATNTATATRTPTAEPEVFFGEWVVDASAGDDNNSCFSAEKPCRTIGAAIDKASDFDFILVRYGIYTENLYIDKNLYIVGVDSELVIIDGSGKPEPVITVGYEAYDLTLDGLTITGGNHSASGGGIQNSGYLRLVNVTVTGNTSEADGGGIANYGTLILENTIVQNNLGFMGGGIYNSYDASYVADASSMVSDNNAILTAGSSDVYRDVCSTDVVLGFDDGITMCENLAENEACVLSPVTVTLADKSTRSLSRGSLFSLTEVSSIDFSHTNAGAGAIYANANLGGELTRLYVRGDGDIPVAPPDVPLARGRQAIVSGSITSSLNLRREPSVSGELVTRMFTGIVASVLDGPRNADGFRWWFLRLPNGTEGWAAEEVEGVKTLRPIRLGELKVGSRYTIFGGGSRGVNLRQEPSTSARVLRTIVQGFDVTLLDGPFEEGGFRWWLARTGDGVIGWLVDAVDGENTLIPVITERVGVPQAYTAAGICRVYANNPLVVERPGARTQVGLTNSWLR